ncbi:replication-relaxation family protein [Kitasatospora sp. GAS1066B]|uniref:replication-relaxation family protein n=1 Tax=Kitasatospora sp. GAS1066B TaxID=3156271 RepID=UPI003510D62E
MTDGLIGIRPARKRFGRTVSERGVRPRGSANGREDLALVPGAVLNYVHTDETERTRTLLTFFVELDRATMTIARLAHKLHAYARYHQYTPEPPGPRANRTPTRGTAAVPAWRHRYPAYCSSSPTPNPPASTDASPTYAASPTPTHS